MATQLPVAPPAHLWRWAVPKPETPHQATSDRNGKNLGTWAICKMNMLLHGLPDARIEKGDTIRDLLRTPDGPALYVHNGKGRRDRTVPVTGSVERAIRRYIAETADLRGQASPLFLADDNGTATRGHHRLSARSIAIMLAHAATRAGIEGKSVSPHALRHTFATRSFRKTRDLVAVSRLLGHAGVATTERYCREA